MDLKTRAILNVNLMMMSQKQSDIKAIQVNEDVLNDVMTVRSCFNCDHSDGVQTRQPFVVCVIMRHLQLGLLPAGVKLLIIYRFNAHMRTT